MSALISGAVVSRHEHPSVGRTWRELYEEAMIETNPCRMKNRIQAAEDAIVQRSRELAVLRKFGNEDAELTSAILSLCDLRRAVNTRGP